ncbi:DUF4252 domain-containing protein [Sinomicrobium pectinilyticum]|nr:DUF4252 domain-containing protein [Sinomicrobium pectinilyticum]
MKRRNNLWTGAFLALFLAVMSACGDGQSLQQYYVDSAEKEGFISLDIPSSMLNISNADLTEEQKEAYRSVKKLNVLALPVTTENREVFETEKAKVNAILAEGGFQELFRMSDKNRRAVLKYLGDDKSIDEVVFFGADPDRGFALVRILGKGMNPEKMMEFVKLIEKSDIDEGQLGDLKKLLGE